MASTEQTILNLDELIPEERYVQLRGTTYVVKPPTVKMYLEVMKQRQRTKYADKDLEMTEQAMMMIKLACPDIPADMLADLPLRALTKLSDMVQEMMEDVASENEEDGDADVGE